MKFGSVCSGIEAASVAWAPLGWECAFVSEIEPFPSAVLAHHYPSVPNLGDFTRIEGAAWKGCIDLLVGGTPCQAFSVAGLRKGLHDERGNLTLAFVELVHAIEPWGVVWENVPGVLSDKTNAFGCLLAGMVGADAPLVPPNGQRWTDAGYVDGPRRRAAWRILDAQYLHLAQRRERVFVVSFRAGDGPHPGAVLFEPESVRRDSPQSREAWESVACTLRSGASGGRSHGKVNGTDRGELIAHGYHETGQGWWTEGPLGLRADPGGMPENVVTHSLRADGFDASEDGTGRGTPLVPVVSPAIKARDHKGPSSDGDGDGDGACLVPLSFNPRQDPDVSFGAVGAVGAVGAKDTGHAIAFSCKDHGADAGDTAPTLRAMGHDGSHANAGGQLAVAFDTTRVTSKANRSNPKSGDPCHPLAAGAHAPAVATTMAVRRLTPVECSRLQGFPDDYLPTVPYRGKFPADGPMYRALGNSMATNVMRWIGWRIQLVKEAWDAPTPPPTHGEPSE